MTDSRGFCPGEGQNWPSDFESRNKQHNVEIHAWNRGRVTTLFEYVDSIKSAGKKYDLIIFQTGHHEYVHMWPPRIFKHKVGKFDKNYEEHITEIEKNRARYRNDPMVHKALKHVKLYAKNVLLIGLHTIRPKLEEPTLIMNDVYNIDEVDYFNLPVHMSWRAVHCYDETHYSELGREYICSYIERYIERIERTVPTILSKIGE